MRIGILKCDSRDQSQPSGFGPQEERAISLLHHADRKIQTFVFDVANGDYPFTADFCDAYVCMGSEASVYDPEPWMKRLAAYIHDLYAYQIPLVGICFGHQMIAHAMGGEVRRVDPGNRGYGILPLEIIRRESWMIPPKTDCLQLLHYHGDQVTRLPDGAVLLGSSPHCPNALLRVGNHFLGIQAHPEMTREFCRELMHVRAASFSKEKFDEVLRGLHVEQEGQLLGQWLLRFCKSSCDAALRGRPGL